jgi:hypothetical protein
MKPFFKIIFCFVCLLWSPAGFAQPSFRIFHVFPSGEAGAFAKPFTSFEVGYQPKFQKYFLNGVRASLSLMYLNLHPNAAALLQKPVPIDGNKVLLGTFGTDFALINAYQYYVYCGLDYTMGFTRTYPAKTAARN